MTNFLPQGLTTGVGSLPYTDMNMALDKIWECIPFIPHWPQLPRLGAESSFTGQYLRGLVETGVINNYEKPIFQSKSPDWSERMTRFYELYLKAEAGDEEALDTFGFSDESGAGFNAFCHDLQDKGRRTAKLIKGQMSGPLTLGLYITDQEQRACYYDDMMRDMLIKNLTMHARWQTHRLMQTGVPAIMSIDDPGLYAFGSSTFVSLDRNKIVADLNAIAQTIIAQGGIPTVHVCAGADWTLVFDSCVQGVNFDAYDYMSSMLVAAEELERFLARGGWLLWGIVPTSEKAFEETGETLIRRMEKNIAVLVQRGVNEERLRKQSMMTPACGTGTLSTDLSDRIYGLLKELGQEYESCLSSEYKI